MLSPDTQEFTFNFEGRQVKAHTGQTVSAALLSQGLLTHMTGRNGSPRGPFCGIGSCHDCLLVINDRPPARGCMTTANAGMVVKRQPRLTEARISARAFAPEEPLNESVIDVLVVGGGPSGLAAATSLAIRGASVILVDERGALGGQYYKQPMVEGRSRDSQARAGKRAIQRAQRANVILSPGTLVWGAFREAESLLIGILRDEKASYLRPRLLVIATGADEQPDPRPGWTLPGVMTTGAGQTLLRSYGTTIGNSVLIAGNGPLNLQLAAEMAQAGVGVVALVEAAAPPWARPGTAFRLLTRSPRLGIAGLRHIVTLRKKGIPIYWESQLLQVEGEERVNQAIISRGNGRKQCIAADAVYLGDGFAPANALSRLLGCRHRSDRRQLGGLSVERDIWGGVSEPDILVVGEAGAFGGAQVAAVQGMLAGREGARRLGLRVGGRQRRLKSDLARHERFQRALWSLFAPRHSLPALSDETIACRCEAVTVNTIRACIIGSEVRDLSSLKRLTRAGLGRCQGRFCHRTLLALCEEAQPGAVITERDLSAPQVPLRPIQVATLAREKPEWRGHTRVPLPSIPHNARTLRKETTAPSLSSSEKQSTDVLIVGAGIVGLSAALFLARAGKKVVVLDRGHPNSGASGGNAGSLHAQLLSFDHARQDNRLLPAVLTMPLQRDSIALWGDLQRELKGNFEMSTTGGFVVAETDSDLAFLKDKIRLERTQGVEVSLIDAAALRRLEPALSHALVGAAYCPQEGKINPLLASAAIAKAAREAGAIIVPLAPVWSITKANDSFDVESAAGSWRAGRVVNAAGAFAAQVGAMLGVEVPVHGAPLQMIVTEPAQPLIGSLIAHASRHLTLKQAASGAILIGGGWSAGLDPIHQHPRPSRASIEGSLWIAQHVAPAIGALHMVRSWAAMNIDIDGAPILGEHPGVTGFYNAVTSNGYTLGPLVGHLTAQLILHGYAGRDLSAFSIERFNL